MLNAEHVLCSEAKSIRNFPPSLLHTSHLTCYKYEEKFLRHHDVMIMIKHLVFHSNGKIFTTCAREIAEISASVNDFRVQCDSL